MGLLDDPILQSRYMISKRKVRLWESEFLKKNGSNPTKVDIKLAPTDVRDAYKIYYKLKTRALEESLRESFSEDTEKSVFGDSGVDLILSQTEHEVSKCKLPGFAEKPRPVRTALKDIQNETEDTEKKKNSVDEGCVTDSVDTSLHMNSESVWGAHLNKSHSQLSTEDEMKTKHFLKRSSSFSFSEKLFAGSKFSKRNPRKSLNTNRPTEVLKSIDGSADQENKVPVMVASKLQDTPDCGNLISTDPKPFAPLSQGMEECGYKIVSGSLSLNCQPTNIINKALMDLDNSRNLLKAERKIDKGWLERHTDSVCYDSGVSNLSSQDGENSSCSEDTPVSVMTSSSQNTSNVHSSEQTSSQAVYSDEDLVYNSESEEELGLKRKRKSLAKKKNYSDGAGLERSATQLSVKRPRLDSDLLSVGSNVKRPSVSVNNLGQQDIYNMNSSVITRQCGISDISSKQFELKTQTEQKNYTLPVKNKSQPDNNLPHINSADTGNNSESKIRSTYPVNKLNEVSQPVKSMEIAGDNTSELCQKQKYVTKIDEYDINTIADCIVAAGSSQANNRKTLKKVTKKEILENKVASGTANENFVRINIKKKVYVRGKKTMTFAKYKKMEWKKKKKESSAGNGGYSYSALSTCFKCGDVGHFARNCSSVKATDKLLPLEDVEEEDDSPFPTLDEVAAMAAEPEHNSRRRKDIYNFSEEDPFQTGENESNNIAPAVTEELSFFHRIASPSVPPLYHLKDDGSVIDTPEEVYRALELFGHDKFRHGQEEAIMRILSGKSTLLMLATGSGKSLCYQLPAYLFSQHSHCITLVISPLVSLMEDQVTRIASCLQAACLHTNQTEKQREKVIDMVKSGKLHILLVSPEAVVSCERSAGFGGILKQLPPIAFACIDEAHCVSQWSHNFRPSYLSICKVLREKLKVQTILGLTATATKSTSASIVRHLSIPDGDKGVIKDIPLPKNLVLTVSKDENKDQSLIKLFTGTRFKECQSVIIYCTRRDECERLAKLIRTYLQDISRPESNAKRSRISWNAEPYHAGLSAARRKAVQQAFMAGKLRIVIATVAFGMGINKRDIRAVIHYNMPKSFESYVQEVGRAGRDGEPAFCHLFLDSEGKDKQELRRHIHANSVDRHTIRKLLQKVFIPCKCLRISKLLEDVNFEDTNALDGSFEGSKTEVETDTVCAIQETPEKKQPIICSGHEVAFSVDETVRALDLPQENISTMLCYMELHPKSLVKVLPAVYIKCDLISYKGPKALKAAIRKSPPLAMAVALDQRRGISHEKSNRIEFSVIEIASALDWDSGMVKAHLKQLEWTKINDKWRRTGITVQFSDLGFHIVAPGNLSSSELDDALDSLYERVDKQEKTALQQLECIFKALNSVTYSAYTQMTDSTDIERSNKLKEIVRNYFSEENFGTDVKPVEETLKNEDQVCADIRHLVCSYKDSTFTGRAVARIFHGIASPCFPANIWGRCKFWRAHLNVEFHLLCKLATREILRLR